MVRIFVILIIVMKRLHRTRGAGDETLFLIVIVVLLLLSWMNTLTEKKNGGHTATSTSPFSLESTITSNSSQSQNRPQTPAQVDTNKSEYYGQVSIESGNSSSEFQPSSEYIALVGSYSLKSPISLSGWYLTNGKGTRVYQVGSSVQHFKSDVVYIPQVVQVYRPGSTQSTSPILLPENGRVYVITGRNLYNSQVVPSFRTNSCIGYLTHENKDSLKLIPNIYSSCPAPTKEYVQGTLESSCRQFVDYMSSCHTPNFIDSVKKGTTPEVGYVDTVGGLTQSCQDFLKSHFSYNACLTNHSSDPKFQGNEWYVYLNRPFELWATDHETITLFDSNGKIVSEYSY